MPGLPREVLFGNLEKVPRGWVTRGFLEENVWWWRKERVPLERFVTDKAAGWPNCELFRHFHQEIPASDQSALSQIRSLTQAQGEELAIRIYKQVDPFLMENLPKWWEQEQAGAKAYEWEARKIGKYPCGETYLCLTADQRTQWREAHERLNMAAVPHVAAEDDERAAGAARGWTRRFCFNLAGHDGYIIKEFRSHLDFERRRLRKPNPPRPNQYRQTENQTPLSSAEEFDSARTVALDLGAATVWTRWFRFNLDGLDGKILGELDGHLAHERERLKCLNPPQPNQNRRPLKLKHSWADIECIDVTIYCGEKTTTRERQRKSDTRRKLG